MGEGWGDWYATAVSAIHLLASLITARLTIRFRSA